MAEVHDAVGTWPNSMLPWTTKERTGFPITL